MSQAAPYYEFEDVNQAVVGLFRDALRPGDPGSTVLDLGCGRARLGGEIEKLGYRVTGIESSPAAHEVARRRITELIELDLMQFDEIERSLDGRRFDWILAADVLEDLPYPLDALRFYRRLLAPGGRLVVSLPNVAVWDNRLAVLLGRFDYKDSGVLDRTHLRFFTFRTARELLQDAGFAITRAELEPGIVRGFLPLIKRALGGGKGDPGAIVDSSAYRAYARYVLPVEHAVCRLLPGLLAFRTVMQASFAGEA